MTAITSVVGQSGRRYFMERVLQNKPGPLGRVYLASAGSQRYVLKSVSQPDFKYFQHMFGDLQRSPYVRVADDAFPDHSMFAYKYFRDHLLSFAQTDVPLPLIKRILRDSLRGIAALHQKGIVHTDIKANNIMVDWSAKDNNTIIQQVQIADIEDAAYIANDQALIGRQVGNWMWRSPEAHASGQVHKPSDIFSFGIVCIYALTKRVIFAVGDEELKEGEDKLAIVLERQLSYFSDLESLGGLLQHLGDSPWVEIFTVIAEGFNEQFPGAPFMLWKDIEPDFKDLVGKMTSIDPKRRITAQEALTHPWFADAA
ncbi:kinase-like domain-containing protein [Pyrenochaeta sp. MPI-SDFR-AT-0127]|nr:kinase-like domain-containing protein [Pyrenochaeta sp. MPI-SDFR-AT-0127]